MKLIMENGGAEIDTLLQQLQNNPKAGKDGEQVGASKGGHKKGSLSSMHSAKLELQKNNHQLYNQSKTTLSKRVAELERQIKDKDMKIESLKHKND